MKQLLYILTFSALLQAGSIEDEIGIYVGVNSTKNEDGNKFENPSLGISYHNNKYLISPRVDLDYTKVNNEVASSLLKASVNGVYEYENSTFMTPYALAGVGYEYVGGAKKDVFDSNLFIQGGAGVKVNLKQGFKARVEAKALQILGARNQDNEFMLTAGLSMPLGIQKPVKKPRPVVRQVVQPVVAPVIIKQPVKVLHSNDNECSIKISAPDMDRDGIPNSIDQCPATPCSFTVDRYGCPIKTTLKINFKTNSAQIEASSYGRVYQFAQFLVKNKGSNVRIVGHTDNRGSAKYNWGLSKRRAEAIVRVLLKQGVSPARLEAIGQGESMPLSTNATELGRAMNRRIEAELFYPKGRR